MLRSRHVVRKLNCELTMSGDDVKTVQKNLGHHIAAFPLDMYGHVTEEMKRNSAARMDEFIKGVKSSIM